MSELTVKDFVTNGNVAIFNSFRNGIFYYDISNVKNSKWYQFQVPIDDINGVTINKTEKAITMMRWIRKSMEDGTLIKQQ